MIKFISATRSKQIDLKQLLGFLSDSFYFDLNNIWKFTLKENEASFQNIMFFDSSNNLVIFDKKMEIWFVLKLNCNFLTLSLYKSKIFCKYILNVFHYILLFPTFCFNHLDL